MSTCRLTCLNLSLPGTAWHGLSPAVPGRRTEKVLTVSTRPDLLGNADGITSVPIAAGPHPARRGGAGVRHQSVGLPPEAPTPLAGVEPRFVPRPQARGPHVGPSGDEPRLHPDERGGDPFGLQL